MNNLEDYCDLISHILKVNIMCGFSTEELEAFCEKDRFHSSQLYFHAEEMDNLFNDIHECEVVSIIDAFQIRLLLTRIDDKPVIVGPFCSESLSTEESEVILEKAGIAKSMATNLLLYRSRCPVCQEKDVVYVLHVLMNKYLGVTEFTDIRKLDLTSPPIRTDNAEDLTPKADQIAERYAVETTMMESIEAGDAHSAVKNWNRLHQRVSYLRKMYGHTIENARESALGSRTVIRLSGMRAGIAPHILDELTKNTREKNLKAKSIDEITANTEALIWAVCREAKRVKDEGGSTIVSSVKFYMNSHYREPLSIEQIADELGVAESGMIRSFRNETGMTPGAYLASVRMKKAEELLKTTRWTIQRIASEVGVPDANYFVKVFKRAYGMTPSAYRKTTKHKAGPQVKRT